MKILLNITKLLCVCLISSSIHSQNLKRVKVSDSEKREGIVKKYSHVGKYEGSINLLLYSNKKYYYTINSTNYHAFSQGQWNIKNTDIYLSSDITDTAVPVVIKYLTEDTINIKSPFFIPVNLKGDKFPDARIYVNNDTTYCFPFFDTCIGNYTMIDKVKIDFGDGFKSKWIKLNFEESKKIQFIAQTKFVLSSYLSFKKRRYKIVRSELELFTSNKK